MKNGNGRLNRSKKAQTTAMQTNYLKLPIFLLPFHGYDSWRSMGVKIAGNEARRIRIHHACMMCPS